MRRFRWQLAASCLAVALMQTACMHIQGKTVARKDAPNLLIADDGSICVVSKERFDKTEVGMKALCAWKGETIPQQ